MPDVDDTVGKIQKTVSEKLHKNPVHQIKLERYASQPGKNFIAWFYFHHQQKEEGDEVNTNHPLHPGTQQAAGDLQRIAPFPVIPQDMVVQPF